jgi:hypothetical protein
MNQTQKAVIVGAVILVAVILVAVQVHHRSAAAKALQELDSAPTADEVQQMTVDERAELSAQRQAEDALAGPPPGSEKGR